MTELADQTPLAQMMPHGDALAHQSGPVKPKSRSRVIAETLLPPLILGAVIIAIWYFISYGILDARKRFLLEPHSTARRVTGLW